MANTRTGKRTVRKTASNGLPALLARLPDDARRAIAHNRAELEAVRGVRREVERRAEAIVREAERRLLRQINAASEEQVRRLERRVAKLERRRREGLRRCPTRARCARSPSPPTSRTTQCPRSRGRWSSRNATTSELVLARASSETPAPDFAPMPESNYRSVRDEARARSSRR